MGKIVAWVAALGQDINFVAFWAHFGVAALVAEHVHGASDHSKIDTLIVIAVVSAFKEFLFDARYETDPPQDFTDNLFDWIGWVTGAVFGFGFAVGWW
jgi:hypothetical protein